MQLQGREGGNISRHVIDVWPDDGARDRMERNAAAPSTGVSWISASGRTSLDSALGWAGEFTLHLLPSLPPLQWRAASVFPNTAPGVWQHGSASRAA